jgi:hypothetical protein
VLAGAEANVTLPVFALTKSIFEPTGNCKLFASVREITISVLLLQ